MENNNALQVFSNEAFKVRTTTDAKGTIWFVARDIAEALEYKESTINNAIGTLFQSVPEIWADKKRFLVRSENGIEQEREMLCLTEQGVYFFLGRSDKKKALPYQIWIADDVVPSIRKHGMYITPAKVQELMKDPDVWIQIFQTLKDEQLKVKALQEQAEKDKPKVIFAESVEASNGTILIRELAKLLRQNGYITG